MSVSAAVQESSPSESVVEEVASNEGVDPMELDMPLFEAIDPDALDALVSDAEEDRSGPPIEIAFSFHGYDVFVNSDGLVHVSQESRTS